MNNANNNIKENNSLIKNSVKILKNKVNIWFLISQLVVNISYGIIYGLMMLMLTKYIGFEVSFASVFIIICNLIGSFVCSLFNKFGILKDYTIYQILLVYACIQFGGDTNYIDELKNGKFNFGVLGFFLLGYLFDFPAAEDVALEMYAAGLEEADLAFSYLAKVTPLYWDRYPENIKDKIIDQGSSILYKNISRELWSKLSLMHKFKLVHKVVTEELKVFHDLNAICQCYDNSDTTRTIFLADGSESDLKDIRKEKDTTLKSLMLGFCIAPEVYKPGIDIDTNQYTPSKRISKFIEVSEGDTMFNNMLWQVVSDIEYAASGSNRFDFEFPSFE